MATLGFFDMAILASGNSRFQTLQELQAYARANPGKLNVACINIGSTQHLAAELFKTTAVEAGVRGFNAASWNALAAPARTPPEQLRELLGSEIKRWADVIARANVPRQ